MDTITLCIKAHAAQPEHLKRARSADLEQPAQNVISVKENVFSIKENVFSIKENVFSIECVLYSMYSL